MTTGATPEQGVFGQSCLTCSSFCYYFQTPPLFGCFERMFVDFRADLTDVRLAVVVDLGVNCPKYSPIRRVGDDLRRFFETIERSRERLHE